MRILVSNDDGIYAEGLRALVKRLGEEPENEVYVVAPDRERSATGHAITLHKPLRLEEVCIDGNVKGAWSTNGTPADCVLFAVGAILSTPPDVVISGINDSPNLGSEVLYSGTVSAAMEGTVIGVHSISVSLACTEGGHNFATAAEFIARLLKLLPESGLPRGCLLNVNVPDVKWNQLKGIAVTEMSFRPYKQAFERRIDPRGKVYYWLSGQAIEKPVPTTTDAWAILNGKISITPICFDMTDRATLEIMKNWRELNVLGRSAGISS